MSVRSCLADPSALVIVDTSVAINLRATGVARLILGALPCRFILVQEVVNELKSDNKHALKEISSYAELVASGQIEIAQLSDIGMEHFVELVSGHSADTLDDGEAATIAYALECKATVVIDERKANRICTERFSMLPTACTVDVLAQGAVCQALGSTGHADAVFNALYYGRMRVPSHHMEWILDIIGPERAAQCNSLPRSIRTSINSGTYSMR